MFAEFSAGVHERLQVIALRLDSLQDLGELAIFHVAIVDLQLSCDLIRIVFDCSEVVGEPLRHLIGKPHFTQDQLVLDHPCECWQRRLVRLLQFAHQNCFLLQQFQ